MPADEQPPRDDEHWSALLAWLRDAHGMDVGRSGLRVERRDAEGAGKGLFALEACPPSTTLFTIPAAAMINVRTLAPLYPRKKGHKNRLSATQMVSMHLTLHRPDAEKDSGDPSFGPFISTMPREFDSHPLWWLAHAHLGTANTHQASLLASLPPSITSALQKVLRLFLGDWTAICAYISSHPGVVEHTSRAGLTHRDFCEDNRAVFDDYLWGWLNVNTRCIYYVVNPDPSASENLALCPILDFANHAPTNPHVFPVLPTEIFPSIPGSSNGKRVGTGGDYVFMSSSQTPIRQDEELFLRYGGHSNRTLFVEYGFINQWETGQCYKGDFPGEVDLQDVVEQLFEKMSRGADLAKEILEDEGYWGDWTLHAAPAPAHPSYRLATALRLYHCITDTESPDIAVDEWREVLLGQRDAVSQENEFAWRATLLDICETVTVRATSGVAAVGRLSLGDPWSVWMKDAIKALWREEDEVARAVAASVRAGEEF